MQSSSPDSQVIRLSAALHYPILTLDDEIAAAMAYREGSESHSSDEADSANSLSSYEWVHNSTSHDDEGDSVVSFEISTAGETASMTGTDDSDDLAAERMSPEPYNRDVVAPSHPLESLSSAQFEEDSILTTKEELHQNKSIRFTEDPESHPSSLVDVVQTICNSEEYDTTSKCVVQNLTTLRQTMSKQGVVLKTPFRILYVGDPKRKKEILEAIGQAIASTPFAERHGQNAEIEQAKFSIVPISSSSGFASSTQIELIPTNDHQLVVEHFTEADYQRFLEGNSKRQLFQKHDLAVLYHAPYTGMLMQQLRQEDMFALVRCAGYPRLEIAEDGEGEYVRDFKPYENRAIHMCLESRISGMEYYSPHLMPVELSIFLNVDPLQLNRNLACITNIKSPGSKLLDLVDTKDIVSSLALGWQWSKSATKTATTFLFNLPLQYKWISTSLTFITDRQVFSSAMFLGTIIALLLSLLLSFLQEPSWQVKPAAGMQSVEITTSLGVAPWTLAPTTAPMGQVIAAPTTSSMSSKDAVSKRQLSVIDSKTSLSKFTPQPGCTKKYSRFKSFYLLESDDGDIQLELPKALTSMRHPPKVFLSAMAGNPKDTNVMTVKLDVKDAKDGKMNVSVPSREKYGCIDIRVWTETALRLEQTFELCRPPPLPNDSAFKAIALRLSQESTRLNAIAGKLSDEGKRISKIATRSIAESGLTMQALVKQSQDWQKRSADRIQRSKSQIEVMTTALGAHLTLQKNWIKTGVGQQQTKASKHLYSLQKKAAKDLIKYQRRFTRKLHKAQKQANKDWAKASKDLAKASRDLAQWSEGATYALSRHIEHVRSLTKYQRPAKLWMKLPIKATELGPLDKARRRARKLWNALPKRKSTVNGIPDDEVNAYYG